MGFATVVPSSCDGYPTPHRPSSEHLVSSTCSSALQDHPASALDELLPASNRWEGPPGIGAVRRCWKADYAPSTLPLVPLARKIILHSPVSDERLLAAFVEQCLRDRVSLIAVVGPGCARLEDLIDEIVVGDGSDPGRCVCTTSHPDEPFENVLNVVERWSLDRSDRFQEVRL